MKEEAETVAVIKVRDDGGSAQSARNGRVKREREREDSGYIWL